MKKNIGHIVENGIKTKDKLSLPFNEKKDKIKSPEPQVKPARESNKSLHKKSLLKPSASTNKLKAIIEEENGVREALRKGKIRKS